jgi:four helix bundle protein
MEEFSYRKLRVYQHSKKLVLLIYDLLKYFPKEENYALCDQLRRAVISIPSNIAEGISRTSHKEQVHFLEISFGSLNEVMCQIEIAYELGIITQEHLQLVEEYYRLIAQMLSGLRRSRIEGHT